MKLNQLLAIEKGLKTTAEAQLTALHHKLAKPALLAGLSRYYQKKNDEDTDLPPPDQQQVVQVRVEESLAAVTLALSGLWDLTLAKDRANSEAKADVVVGSKTLLAGVPVTALLFLEKQLVNLATFVEKLPVLDAAQAWTWDTASACYRSAEERTIRTKKVPRTLVKAEATKEHPAQVDTWLEDVGVGTWTQKSYSGAIPEERRRVLAARVEQLAQAVKVAREAANLTEVKEAKEAKAVFDFLFAKS